MTDYTEVLTPAVLPTKRSALERAAGFMERHLSELRQQAIREDRLSENSTYASHSERFVLDATETAYAAGMLREMAATEPDGPRSRQVR